VAENKYVHNKHKAPIIVHTRDDKGKILETITFPPERIDPVTGRVVSTGYTPLTEARYEELCKVSRTFRHYKDKLNLLSVQDDLPPEAKTPHEALADARRGEREALAKITALETEIDGLKTKLLDAEEKYKTLQSASTDSEKTKPLNDTIKDLTAKNEKLSEFTVDCLRQLDQLAQNGKVTQNDVKQLAGKASGTFKGLFEKKG